MVYGQSGRYLDVRCALLREKIVEEVVLMPHFKWENIKETMITPKHSSAKGQTILGNMIMLQRFDYKGDRGDGKNGATPHHHPEEQFLIVTKGKLKMCEGGQWYNLDTGDVFWIPANSVHEMVVEGEAEIYQFKVRVPGHSVYDGSWDSDSQEAWDNITKTFGLMRQKYTETAPW
jgi:mannose-6-phosphate isomerase-like protein (cupin superfamily)